MRGVRLAGVALVIAAVACSDALEQTTPIGQEIVILDGQASVLTLVNAGDFSVTTLPLLFPVPAATTITGRGSVILLPGGSIDSVQVLRLAGGSTVIGLNGLHPTGASFESDSVAWVAGPGLAQIRQLLLTGGGTAGRNVGVDPVATAVIDSQVFSINSNPTNTNPPGPSTLTSYRLSGGLPDSVLLTGIDAHYALVGDDSLLYVIERGDSGKADGRMSIVDPAAHQEIVVINGLGERPGPGVFHPTGRILIASPTNGILEVDALTRSVIRGPGSGIKPGGKGVVALSLDARGRVYAVSNTPCGTAGTLYVLSRPPDYNVITTVSLGLCPVASAVAEMPTQ